MGKSLKGKELGKGITQRKDKLYQARFTDSTGKTKTIYAKTYKEILQNLKSQATLSQEQLSQEQTLQEQSTQEQTPREQSAQEQTSQGQSLQEQTSQETSTQEQSSQKQSSQEQLLQEQSAQEQFLQEQLPQEQPLQENPLQEPLLQESPLQEHPAQEPSLQEPPLQAQHAAQQQDFQLQIQQTPVITPQPQQPQLSEAQQSAPVSRSITLNEWYEIWVSTCKKNCRDTTLRTYALQYNRLRDTIGTKSLSSLNHIMLQRVFNDLKSDASRNACKKLIVDILNCAMEANLITKNPALHIKTKIDNLEKSEKRVLTENEIQLIYKTVKNDRLYCFLVVALNTGMRIGEIIGLTWDCVDFENSIIKVEKTLCYLPNNGNGIYEFHPPKTKAGRRSIPMTKQVREVLQEQKLWQESLPEDSVSLEGFESLIFTSKTYRPLHTANIQDSINYLVKKINRQNPEIDFKPFTPHCLRHTFATNCIAKGMRPKTLQKLLGHNSLQMTMDLYCHVREDTLKEEMAMIAEME